MQNITKASQVVRNILSQSPGGCGPSSTSTEIITGGRGLSSTATVAETPNLADVTEGAAVGAGGPGLSSGSTAIPFVSLDSDDVSGSSSLISPPSPNGYSRSPTSPMRSFTLASETVMTKMSDLIKHKGSHLGERSLEPLELRNMNESLWDIRENDEAFLHLATESTIYYIRPCYREVYSVLEEMFRGKKDIGDLKCCTCALITGTPGIGKSVFGLVLIKLIMQRPKPTLILYNPALSDDTEIFWQGRYFTATENHHHRQRMRVDTFSEVEKIRVAGVREGVAKLFGTVALGEPAAVDGSVADKLGKRAARGERREGFYQRSHRNRCFGSRPILFDDLARADVNDDVVDVWSGREHERQEDGHGFNL